MPALAAARAIPWKRVIALAQIVSSRVSDDIPKKDRDRLKRIVSKSKGDPRQVTASDHAQVLRLLRELDDQKLGRELAAVGLTAKLLKR